MENSRNNKLDFFVSSIATIYGYMCNFYTWNGGRPSTFSEILVFVSLPLLYISQISVKCDLQVVF